MSTLCSISTNPRCRCLARRNDPRHNDRLKLTGAAILVFRSFNVLAGGPGSLALAFAGLVGSNAMLRIRHYGICARPELLHPPGVDPDFADLLCGETILIRSYEGGVTAWSYDDHL